MRNKEKETKNHAYFPQIGGSSILTPKGPCNLRNVMQNRKRGPGLAFIRKYGLKNMNVIFGKDGMEWEVLR